MADFQLRHTVMAAQPCTLDTATRLWNLEQHQRIFLRHLSEPEDIDRILYAFLCVHVFGGKYDDTLSTGESFSAIKKLCEVHQIEPVFEVRDYPALKRGKTSGHKIILLSDSGSAIENEKKALEIIRHFSALEQSAITETIIGLIEKFDEADIIKYVERHNSNLRSDDLEAFKKRMGSRTPCVKQRSVE